MRDYTDHPAPATALPTDAKERAAYIGRFRDALLCDPDLPAAAKVVGCAIVAHINRDSDQAWPGMGRLAQHLHMGRSRVANAILLLVGAGWFTKEAGGGKATNRYAVDQAKVPEKSPFQLKHHKETGCSPGGTGVVTGRDGGVHHTGHDLVDYPSDYKPTSAAPADAVAVEDYFKSICRAMNDVKRAWQAGDLSEDEAIGEIGTIAGRGPVAYDDGDIDHREAGALFDIFVRICAEITDRQQTKPAARGAALFAEQRLAAGLTRGQAGKLIGMDAACIRRIEAGTVDVSPYTRKKWTTALADITPSLRLVH